MSTQLKAVETEEQISESDLQVYRFAIQEFNQAQELVIQAKGALEMMKRYLQSRYELKAGDRVELDSEGQIVRQVLPDQ